MLSKYSANMKEYWVYMIIYHITRPVVHVTSWSNIIVNHNNQCIKCINGVYYNYNIEYTLLEGTLEKMP